MVMFPGSDLLGPQITPKTTYGGGDARPPYLQMRTPITPKIGEVNRPGLMDALNKSRQGFGTRPVVTPKSTAMPGEVADKRPGQGSRSEGMPGFYGSEQGSQFGGGQKPNIGPRPDSGITTDMGLRESMRKEKEKANQQRAYGLGDLYKFFKTDLDEQRKSAMSGAVADAARRGVYYGSPLTTSQGDIESQYLRGLGQLQSGIFQGEQQDELSRLGLATNLLGMGGDFMPSAGESPDLGYLGQMFSSGANKQQPAITPKQQELTKQGGQLRPKTVTN